MDDLETMRLRAKAKAKAERERRELGRTPGQEQTVTGLKSFGQGLLELAAGAGSALDRITGTPTRAAFAEVLKRPGVAQKLAGAVTEFWKNIGKNPDKIPTGKDLAKELNISDKTMGEAYEEKGLDASQLGFMANMNAAGAMGLVMDIGLDWSNIVPLGTVAKGMGMAGKPLAKTGAGMTTGVVDMATGTRAASTAAEAAQEASRVGREGLEATFKAEELSDYPQTVLAAKRAGIPVEDLPEAARYGPESNISMMQRSQAEGPLGQPIREMFKRNQEKLQAYAEEGISKIAVPMKPEVAGAHMRTAFDDGMSKIFDSMDATNLNIIKEVPGLKISAKAREKLRKQLNGLEHEYKRRLGSSSPQISGQAQQVMNAIENIRKSNYSYKQIYEQLRDVGEIGFKTKNTMVTLPPDIKAYHRLYGNLNDALHKTILDDVVGGKEILKDLRKNNKLMSELYQEKDAVFKILGDPNKADEKVFASMLGDTRKIKALKRVLSSEDMDAVKSSYIEFLIKRDDDGSFSLKQLFNRMRNNDAQVRALFNEKELTQINEAMSLAQKFGYDKLSFSGTGQSNAFLQMLKNTGARMVEAAISTPLKKTAKAKPAAIAPMFRTPKAYLSTPGSRLKALQVYSVQRQNGKRVDAALKPVFNTEGWTKFEKQYIAKLMERKRGAVNKKDKAMEALIDRDIQNRIEKINKRMGGN